MNSLEVQRLQRLSQALLCGQPKAQRDPAYPSWHLAPPVGLLNDPNGFIHDGHRWHLFYQWNPFACEHGPKCWGHWSSDDLLHWRHQPVALVPAEDYDRDGCYSGSAVVDDAGRLSLLYSGNIECGNDTRIGTQCLAVANEQGLFDKLGPVLPVPEGYTGNVRDPKVWRHQGQWYMVLGAQTQAMTGEVLLFRSADLRQWRQVGVVAGAHRQGLGEFGYMWECPDLFDLQDRETSWQVLICSPQGLPALGDRFANLHQSGYFVGALDYDSGKLSHGAFYELDLGFDFYAPQTALGPDGRRLLYGWMAMADDSEASHPSIEQGWLHCMTAPRELSLHQGRLRQRPARELRRLRGELRHWQGPACQAPRLRADRAELIVQVQGPFELDLRGQASLRWDGATLTLQRRSWHQGRLEQRRWHGRLDRLQLLLDHSSLECFINDGEAVMSMRYYPANDSLNLAFSGHGPLRLEHWPLAATGSGGC